MPLSKLNIVETANGYLFKSYRFRKAKLEHRNLWLQHLRSGDYIPMPGALGRKLPGRRWSCCCLGVYLVATKKHIHVDINTEDVHTLGCSYDNYTDPTRVMLSADFGPISHEAKFHNCFWLANSMWQAPADLLVYLEQVAEEDIKEFAKRLYYNLANTKPIITSLAGVNDFVTNLTKEDTYDDAITIIEEIYYEPKL